MNEFKIVINGYQLKQALEFLAPDESEDEMEQSVVIMFSDQVRDEEGNIEPPGLFCYWDEYPEEGCIPLMKVKGTI